MKTIFLVDADDTVLNFHGASAAALRFAFEERGVLWSKSLLAEFKKINGGLWESLERRELTRATLMERRFHIYLEHLGYTQMDADSFNESFLKHLATHPLYIDGAENFLKELRKRGRVYIVTNGTAWIQKSRFDISNLWSYAEDTFVSDKIGYDKPAKEYTEYVVSHIPDFTRENAVWIGDSLSADVKAAKEGGITSIWYNPNGKVAPAELCADYSAAGYEEILRLIDSCI